MLASAEEGEPLYPHLSILHKVLHGIQDFLRTGNSQYLEFQITERNGIEGLVLKGNDDRAVVVLNIINFTPMESKCLYKYLDINGALSMILNKELQFTNPIYFNDPFDCHPGLFDYEVPEGYKMGWAPKSFIQDKAKSDFGKNRQKAWVCCLSKRKDNLLMWSYYTNHKGVCIGLREDAMTNSLRKSLSLSQTCYLNTEVEYKEILDKPNGIRGRVKPFTYQLCTKGIQWKHEEEVRHIVIEPYPSIPHRMTRLPKKNELIQWTEVRFYPKLSYDCFDSIYLGANISFSDKLSILKAAKESLPGTKIFQMIADHDNFSFDEELVDIDKFLSENKESPLRTAFLRLMHWFPISVTIKYNRPITRRRHFQF